MRKRITILLLTICVCVGCDRVTKSQAILRLVVGVGLVLFAGIVYVVLKPLPATAVLLASFMIGGGLGNLYDRAFNNGAVVDFMNIGIASLRTGIFNVADVAIMIGAFGMLVYSFMTNRRESV